MSSETEVLIIFLAVLIFIIAGGLFLDSQIKIDKEEILITTDKTEYEQGGIVEATVKNNSDKNLFIDYPDVERFENNQWMLIRGGIVWPGCEAIGGMPYLPVDPLDDAVKYQWDQKEKWCDMDNNAHFQEVTAGKYRIESRIIDRTKSEIEDPNNISGLPTKKYLYSNEFTIKEKDQRYSVNYINDNAAQLNGKDIVLEGDITEYCITNSAMWMDGKFKDSTGEIPVIGAREVFHGCFDANFTNETVDQIGIEIDATVKYEEMFDHIGKSVGKVLYLLIKEKSAIDPRCSQKVEEAGSGGNICTVESLGYEFDPEIKKCVGKMVTGCSTKTPFSSLEECQKICEISAGKELPFETITKGDGYYWEKKNYVIKSEEEWVKVLKETGTEVPEPIDFSKDMVIVVSMTATTGGYNIEIVKIIETNDSLEVFIRQISPGPKCIVTQAATSPYHIVKVQKSDKEAIFKIENVKIENEVTICE